MYGIKITTEEEKREEYTLDYVLNLLTSSNNEGKDITVTDSSGMIVFDMVNNNICHMDGYFAKKLIEKIINTYEG